MLNLLGQMIGLPRKKRGPSREKSYFFSNFVGSPLSRFPHQIAIPQKSADCTYLLVMIGQNDTSICVGICAGRGVGPQHVERASIISRSVRGCFVWAIAGVLIAGCLSAAAQVQRSEDASTSPTQKYGEEFRVSTAPSGLEVSSAQSLSRSKTILDNSLPHESR